MVNKATCNFKLMSFNVRGLNNQNKRKSIFNFIERKKIDVCFIQESHSSLAEEQNWENQWGGNIIFNHGARNARGVMILVRKNFDLKIVNMAKDNQGRLIELNCLIQGSPYKLINIYAPTTEMLRLNFFKNLKLQIEREDEEDYKSNIILGGDFNLVQDINLDRKGGSNDFSAVYKKGIDVFEGIKNEINLVDIWRIRNPLVKRFTWRRKNPLISSRLDFWCVSNSLCDYVDEIDILPSVKSDHSPIIIGIKTYENKKGPGLWKLNNTFLSEENYIKTINETLKSMTDIKDNYTDLRIWWEYLKFKIREVSINYGKKRARERREKEERYETKLKYLEEKIDGTDDILVRAGFERERNLIITKLEEIDKHKTEGLILRSRAIWHEEGEKSTKYFMGLCSQNKIKTTINKLIKPDGTETINPQEILSLQKGFYQNLYSERNTKSLDEKKKYIESIQTPSLNEEEMISVEGMITIEELTKSMKSFKEGKSPGNDGITMEFYKKFWGPIGKHLLETLNYGYIHGELTVSQRQAVITLLDKGKDRLLLKNWRPLSMLNVDYKIGSKVIAERLKKYLHKLIHPNQVGYISGRQVASNIRAISDILFYTKQRNISGILMNLDFEKAFDSVDWDFLRLSLKKFNLGDSIIKWVSTFYNNISSCVINNGLTSGYFKVGRGVRQGDPLSPYLFILVSEILASSIRQNKNIKGIKINTRESKLIQYADDTNGTVADVESGKRFLKCVETFGTYSGLKLNKDKTEALWLGKESENKSTPLGVNWPKKPIKTLGVYFSYNKQENERLNFSEKLLKCQHILNSWKQRNLTLLGKALVLKTFIISQFLYITNALDIPKHYLENLEKMMLDYFWGGRKHKLKKEILFRKIEEGGLNFLDIHQLIKANRVKWVGKYLNSEEHLWKQMFEEFMHSNNININILLKANYEKNLKNLGKLQHEIPYFYKEMLMYWSEVGNTDPPKESFLWYNKEIMIGNKSVFHKSFYICDIKYTGDLFGMSGAPLAFENLKAKGLTDNDWFKWSSIVLTIITKKLNKTFKKTDRTTFLVQNTPLEKISSKSLYNSFSPQIENNVEVRVSKYVESSYNFKEIFYICHHMTTDTKSKEFQFRFLYDILVNNYWLKKWKIKQTNECTFCKTSEGNIFHIFWECSHIRTFWNNLNRELRLYTLGNINASTIFYGTKNKLFCTIIFLAKNYIYQSWVGESIPKWEIYKTKLASLRNVESTIAIKNNTIDMYLEKWEPLQQFQLV